MLLLQEAIAHPVVAAEGCDAAMNLAPLFYGYGKITGCILVHPFFLVVAEKRNQIGDSSSALGLTEAS
jgi:hypothetical protein